LGGLGELEEQLLVLGGERPLEVRLGFLGVDAV
jgi:hypothetical protein